MPDHLEHERHQLQSIFGCISLQFGRFLHVIILDLPLTEENFRSSIDRYAHDRT